MFLDIETLPAPESRKKDLQDIYTRKSEKSKKDVGTFENFLENTGFDGSFGRICCIGYAMDDAPALNLEGDEKQMLKDFWTASARIDLFIGFNIIDFDMRFIYQRSVILGVKPTQNLSFAHYKSSPMYDVMWEWSKWNTQYRISLHALAKALGLKSSKEGNIEGKDVAQAYLDGRINEICTYCKADVELTRQIYKKITFAGLQD
ncbi:MAG: ribonuclease H-like domain-containing protein [Patescibacteria group bacterium]